MWFTNIFYKCSEAKAYRLTAIRHRKADKKSKQVELEDIENPNALNARTLFEQFKLFYRIVTKANKCNRTLFGKPT